MAADDGSGARSRKRPRFLAALLYGLWLAGASAVLLGGVEMLLRLADVGRPLPYFVEAEIGGESAVVANEAFTGQFFSGDFDPAPFPERFPPEKAPETYRIFILGDSAAMGEPDAAFSFWRILEIMLRARYPGAPFEIINTATPAINSHVVAPIARDCAHRAPDAFIVYVGNNEVTGPYGTLDALSMRLPPAALEWMTDAVLNTRIGRSAAALRQRGEAARANQRSVPEMVKVSERRHDDPRLGRVYRSFRKNLEEICRAAESADAITVLCTVPSNLRDFSPWRSQLRPGLGEAERSGWTAHFERGVAAQGQGQFEEAVTAFSAAAAIDDTHAALHYRWAQCLEALRRTEDAKRHYILARDYDVQRLRTDSTLNAILRETAAARAPSVRLCDAEERFSAKSPGGVPGWNFFYEYVHMTFVGYHQLAEAVLDSLRPMLPEHVTRHEDPGAKPLSAADCAEALGLTFWDRYRHIKSMAELLGVGQSLFGADMSGELDLLIDQAAALSREARPEAMLDALRVYQARMERPPVGFPELRNCSEFYATLGDAEAALQQAERLHERYPHANETRHILATRLCAAGRCSQAVTVYREYLSHRPHRTKAYLDLATAHARNGDLEEAVEACRTALSINPGYLLPGEDRAAMSLDAASRLAAYRAALEEKERLKQGTFP